MSYLQIIFTILIVLWGFFTIALLYQMFFVVSGVFVKRRFPKTEEKLRYAIMIGARNEQAVIGRLLDSIAKSNYPKDKLTVFVIAHNCTDDTAKIACEKGAVVYEYDNPKECTLGYAYKELIRRINEDYGWQAFDGIFSINADNVIPPEYFSLMNDAFVACGKDTIITSFRNSSNFADNYMSRLYGMYFAACCRYEMRGRAFFDCSTRISGTGYVFPSEIIKDGWEYVTLTEDWEFTSDQVSEGKKIIYCDEAEFFDEQPLTIPVMMRQRLRWARGHTIVFFTRFKKLFKSIFTREKRTLSQRMSTYDATMCILPLGAIGFIMNFLTLILVALSPLFGYDALIVWRSYLVYSATFTAVSYVLTSLSGLILLILERKRVPRLGIRYLVAILLWPFFNLLTALLDFVSLFTKNLQWKQIPHKGS